MNAREAYNLWASQYDSNENKTRDVEGRALRQTLANIDFERCLEIGCGTGKNTEWLVTNGKNITSVDLSEEMLKRARAKISSVNVQFRQADINLPWNFAEGRYDLVTFSLVLEHIENLDHIFQEVNKVLAPGGYVYVGELHPFKQYAGTKARFDTEEGRNIVQCYDHHVSDFVSSAKRSGLQLTELNEYFDDPGRSGIPRILVLLFRLVI